tara:strand:+ start:197 stop:388 length:192 start_codon:yes stop_codon:yes gene_type:complete
MDIEETDTILFLKAKINEEKNIPIESQRIIYAGKLLEDNKTFKDYNIDKNEALIILRIMKNIQ